MKVKPRCLEALAREYWQHYQQRDGSWAYTPDGGTNGTTSSMTCAGISSLVISRPETLQGEPSGSSAIMASRTAGKVGRPTPTSKPASAGSRPDFHGRPELRRLASSGNITISTASSAPAGSAGIRFFGDHDWYREGAEEIVHDQDKLEGFWRGTAVRTLPGHLDQLRLALSGQRDGLRSSSTRSATGSGSDWNNDVGRRAKPRRGRLARLEPPSNLAGRRPQRLPESRTCSRPPSPSSTATTPPSSSTPRGEQGPPRLRRAGRFYLR